MNRSRLVALLVAVLLAAPGASLSAQSKLSFHLGAGLLMPSGDFGDYAEQGWVAFGGVSMPLGSNPKLGLGLSAFYGHADHEGDLDESTDIPGAMLHLDYALATTGTIIPYISGGVGLLQHRYNAGDTGFDDEQETSFLFGGAVGVQIKRFFIDARYIIGDGTDFLSLGAGISFGGAR
jgi:hypothetical protein